MNALFKKSCNDTTHLLWKEPVRGPYSNWPKAWTKLWWMRATLLIVIFVFIGALIMVIASTLPDLSGQ